MTVAGAGWMGPDIAAHGDTVYVVFKQSPEGSDSSHIFCARSFDGGQTFNTPVRVDNIADSLSRFPTVTTDDSGNPIIGFMKFNSSFWNRDGLLHVHPILEILFPLIRKQVAGVVLHL